MSDVLIRGGRVIDPASKLDAVRDVILSEGRVTEVGKKLRSPKGTEVIEANGLWVVPGLIDIHVHLREPGGTSKETIFSGAEAAAAGGFAAVLAMPNTRPPVDKGHLVRYVLSRGREASGAEVMTAAALTEGREGKAPADISGLARAGAVAFTDDGDEVADARVLHACMREAARLGVPVLCHAEEPSLVRGGVMNEGARATELGLPGRPALAEELAVARDLALAADAGARVHVQHVSTRGALSEIRSAREGRLPVTCEATPHHLLLTEDECRGYDPNFKMNPPLRTEADRAALAAALADRTVDAIATDHAPHTIDEKGLEFDKAASGIVGLETALGLVMTEFVAEGAITPARMVELMSLGPARIVGRSDLGTLAPGARGHVTVIDPNAEWTVDPDDFRSRSRNTPFAGRALRGRAVVTLVDGRVVFRL
ncbi:MAG: dihydroorotase [Planctomycetota bacterium]|jgi:dihydroorotase